MKKNEETIELKVAEQVKKASEIIKRGGIILYPTDTIWGIGCDATNAQAVEKIYKIKKREESKALVTLVGNLSMLAKYVEQIPPIAIDLIEINTSPMTIIYPKAISLAHNVIAEDGSIAIRIPLNEFCKQLSLKSGVPIVSTSANISGENAPQTFKQISQEIKQAVDYVVSPSIEEKKNSTKASQIIRLGLKNEVEIIRR